jgi:hypothetical protein
MKGYASLLLLRRKVVHPLRAWDLLRTFSRHMAWKDLLTLLSAGMRERVQRLGGEFRISPGREVARWCRRACRALLDELVLHRVAGDFDAALEPELGGEPGAVRRDGPLAEAELDADLLEGAPDGDESQDL